MNTTFNQPPLAAAEQEKAPNILEEKISSIKTLEEFVVVMSQIEQQKQEDDDTILAIVFAAYATIARKIIEVTGTHTSKNQVFDRKALRATYSEMFTERYGIRKKIDELLR